MVSKRAVVCQQEKEYVVNNMFYGISVAKRPKSPSGWVIIIVYIEMPYQFFCFSKLIPFLV